MKDLRVLIYSNPLVVDKISKQFIYWRDSGFIFTKNLLQQLGETWHYYWLLPEKVVNSGELEWFKVQRNMTFIPYPYSTNIHQNRYEFYGNVLRKAFPYTMDIDVIINNQPEVSANLRVWANNQRRDEPVILNFLHWIDCLESRNFGKNLSGYFWRQYEGVLAGDMTFLHSYYANILFNREAERLGLPTIDNFYYAPPPATIFGKEWIPLPDKKIIVFNHRLNNTTNWQFVVEQLGDLYEERQDFVLWLTDENRNLINQQKLTDLPYIYVKSLPDSQYGYLLDNAHMSVCAHKGYSTWNMAVVDAMANGLFTIVPRTEEIYYHMFGKLGDVHRIYHEFTDFKERVNELLDIPRAELKADIQPLGNILVEIAKDDLDDIYTHIEWLIREKLPKSTPKKYASVVQYIMKNAPVEKKDWVNKFWSFHVNSNFQKIRWLLLLDKHIRDDTTKATPTYYRTAPLV